MRSNGSGFDDEAYNPAQDEARWQAYLALMRKTGQIQVLPGLDDAAPDDTWRPKPPVAVDAGGRRVKVSAEVKPPTEHPSFAPSFKVAAPAVESLAGDLNLATPQPHIDPRGRTGLIAGAAVLIVLLVVAAANGLGQRHETHPPASSAPASRAATTGVAPPPSRPVGPEARPGEGAARATVSDVRAAHPHRRLAIPFKHTHKAKPRPTARHGAVKHHRTPRHPAKQTHSPKSAHAATPKTWTSPFRWSDKRWQGGLSGWAATKPNS